MGHVRLAGAGGYCWSGMRGKHCWLAGVGGCCWISVREKYYWLAGDRWSRTGSLGCSHKLFEMNFFIFEVLNID